MNRYICPLSQRILKTFNCKERLSYLKKKRNLDFLNFQLISFVRVWYKKVGYHLKKELFLGFFESGNLCIYLFQWIVKCIFFPRPVELVFADQVREILIASLSVATAIIASILLLVNLCVKHQRPVLSLVAVLLTFISGEYDLTIFLFVCLCEWNSFSLFFFLKSLF